MLAALAWGLPAVKSYNYSVWLVFQSLPTFNVLFQVDGALLLQSTGMYYVIVLEVKPMRYLWINDYFLPLDGSFRHKLISEWMWLKIWSWMLTLLLWTLPKSWSDRFLSRCTSSSCLNTFNPHKMISHLFEHFAILCSINLWCFWRRLLTICKVLDCFIRCD